MADWSKVLTRGEVEDRRGLAPAVGGLGLGGLALLVALNFLMGGDLGDLAQTLETLPIQNQQAIAPGDFEGEDNYEIFASKVLGSNNETWQKILSEEGREYILPRLVLFRSATRSECGLATSEVGPHYCPYDQTIYLDETFFEVLTQRLGAKGGDVAESYVISHEVGHHLQNQLGLLDDQDSIQRELQADCLTGIWVNSIRDLNILEPNEVYEAMDAAASVGDDRIQKRTTGRVAPEEWTHGSSEARVTAFNRGYEQGSLGACL